jgi:hypothetical protein
MTNANDISQEVSDAYERKFAPRIDTISEMVDALAKDVFNEFEDATDRNDLNVVMAAHFVTLAVADSYRRGTPISPSRLAACIARAVTEQGFGVGGQHIMPIEDVRIVLVPLDSQDASLDNLH